MFSLIFIKALITISFADSSFDITPPVISDVSVVGEGTVYCPKPDDQNPSTSYLRFKATDDLSGVKLESSIGYLGTRRYLGQFESLSKRSKFIIRDAPVAKGDDYYEIPITIYGWIESGEYTIDQLSLVDNADNLSTWHNATPGSVKVNVVNDCWPERGGHPDIVPPVITDVWDQRADDALKAVHAGSTFRLSMIVPEHTEDYGVQSGVYEFNPGTTYELFDESDPAYLKYYPKFVSPSGKTIIYGTISENCVGEDCKPYGCSEDAAEREEILQFEFKVSKFAEPGEYHLQEFNLPDYIGNVFHWTGDAKITVVNEQAVDTDAPIIDAVLGGHAEVGGDGEIQIYAYDPTSTEREGFQPRGKCAYLEHQETGYRIPTCAWGIFDKVKYRDAKIKFEINDWAPPGIYHLKNLFVFDSLGHSTEWKGDTVFFVTPKSN